MRPLVKMEFAAKDAVNAVKRRDLIVVIDVLRCSSTIVTALANGAKSIIPKKHVKTARALHKMRQNYLLAGERKGLKPKGFDLGNSPLEFSPKTVEGKNMILTTTSGTKAIVLSKDAEWVLIGSFLNAAAVAKTVLRITKNRIGFSIVLSGKEGQFSLEDFLCAGSIADDLSAENFEFSDAVIASVLAFRQSRSSLYDVIRTGIHARYLESIGHTEDVEFCSRTNVYKITPILKRGVIFPLSSFP